MSAIDAPRRARRAAVRRRRRRLAALGALVAVAVAVGVAFARSGGGGEGAPSAPAAPATVRVELGGSTLAHSNVRALGHPAALAAVAKAIPTQRIAHVGAAKITYVVNRGAAVAALRRTVHGGGGTVKVSEQAVASSISVPLIGQTLRDDCEATALSMILAYAGHPVDQLTLQQQVAHAKPLDPTSGPNGEEIWGDPSLGFVGRADGSGPAGGFGVYQAPIRALAGRHGLSMTELSGSSPARVYGALLAGRPVLAWVALSAGPYATWTSPAGRTIKINYGEHAVVLTGVEGGAVSVNDPLSDSRLTWTKAEFEQMWAGLGHRALAA